MKKSITYLAVLMLSCSVYAEVRAWADKKGSVYKAEYIIELFDKVTLRDMNGKEFRIPVEELSENDQKYLRVMVPPEIKIDFSKKTDIAPKKYEIVSIISDSLIISPVITVQKVSRRSFTSSLNLEVFLIAQAIENKAYILLSESDFKFLFGPESDSAKEFKPDPVKVTEFVDDTHVDHRGEKYLGYLIVISDARGNVVRTQTDIGAWIEEIAVIEELRKLAVRGAPSLRSRYFDETGRKVDPPRTRYYTERLNY